MSELSEEILALAGEAWALSLLLDSSLQMAMTQFLEEQRQVDPRVIATALAQHARKLNALARTLHPEIVADAVAAKLDHFEDERAAKLSGILERLVAARRGT